MASMIVTFPTVWAHLIGQLLYYMGDDHIVFGSDSMWYGGSTWDDNALWEDTQAPPHPEGRGATPAPPGTPAAHYRPPTQPPQTADRRRRPGPSPRDAP